MLKQEEGNDNRYILQKETNGRERRLWPAPISIVFDKDIPIDEDMERCYENILISKLDDLEAAEGAPKAGADIFITHCSNKLGMRDALVTTGMSKDLIDGWVLGCMLSPSESKCSDCPYIHVGQAMAKHLIAKKS